MTATKRPWFWEPVEPLFAKRSLATRIWSASGVLIAETESAIIGSSGCETHGANAALIVRAVNRDHLFDEAVECLDSIATMLNFAANGHIKDGEEHIVMLKLVSEITILRDRIDEQNKGE